MDRRTYMLNEETFEMLLVPVTLHHESLLIDLGFPRIPPFLELYTYKRHFLFNSKPLYIHVNTQGSLTKV